MTKEEKILLKGGVVYEDNRGYESDNDYEGDYDNDEMYIADLMYEYPKKQIAIPKLKVEPIIIEEPVVYSNYVVPQAIYDRERRSLVRDIAQEQEQIAQEARVQRRNYKREEKPKKERINYINKKKKEVGNVRDFGIVQNEQNIVMKPKSKRVEKEKKDYEEIARMFYPTMEEKSQIVVKKKEPIILAQAPISQEPKMITLADKEYVVKPVDGTFTGAAANIDNNYNESANKEYLNKLKLLSETAQDKKFLNIIDFVLSAEKGFSHRKTDKRTNLGITQSTYNNYNKKYGLPEKDVKNITIQEAIPIYYKDFWKPSKAEKLPFPLALVYFDMFVNSNPRDAKKVLNRSNNDVYMLIKNRKKFYDDVIKRHPEKEEYRKGWYNRLEHIKKYVDEYYKHSDFYD